MAVEYVSVRECEAGDWGPGLRYLGEYSSREAMVMSLESFLEARIEEWGDYLAVPFDTGDIVRSDPLASEEAFVRLVHEGAIPLPEGTEFRLTSAYWRQIQRHGSWDIDRALDE